MKIIVNERELKEYFDGLARLLQPIAPQRPTSDPHITSTIIAEVRQTIREELMTFGLEGQRDLDAYSSNKIKQAFEPYTGRPAELLTPAGTVEGTIMKVGDDYLVLREQGGTSVMVPLEQLIAFQLTGKQLDR